MVCSILKVQVITVGVYRSGCEPLGEIFVPAGSGDPGTICKPATETFFNDSVALNGAV